MPYCDTFVPYKPLLPDSKYDSCKNCNGWRLEHTSQAEENGEMTSLVRFTNISKDKLKELLEWANHDAPGMQYEFEE